MKTSYSLAILLFALIATTVFTSASQAFQEGRFSNQFDDLFADENEDLGPEYSFSGDFTVEQGKRTGTLNVILDIKDGWHGYSQKKLSGQSPTKIDVKPGAEFNLSLIHI